MTEIVEGRDRGRIAALHESGTYFWVDLERDEERYFEFITGSSG